MRRDQRALLEEQCLQMRYVSAHDFGSGGDARSSDVRTKVVGCVSNGVSIYHASSVLKRVRVGFCFEGFQQCVADACEGAIYPGLLIC